ncbi:DUF2798 domain-containing protein [Vibrio vulnificus]|uniref:DUF2798 domain-containing protein n=1 Tax=Vibrio vulnificus TaxID=672 RepID=UPI0010296C3B|nr:DUF2798 domain-containing protein [Vibrio vulnificus]EGR0753486.1 DUF2798 domain-containing protein [Vibrio vulnificus]RZP84771.1 DUF2798 domain-containing protein [Vibrio vulnificus]
MTVQAVINDTAVDDKKTAEQKKTLIIQKVLVMLGMVSLMGGTITGTMTYLNLGFTHTFFEDWATNFFTALVTVIPFGFTMMALLTKVAETLLPNMAAKARDALVGVIMALIMESGMAFTSAYNNIGLDNQSEFLTAWMDGVLGALPVALVLMLTVSMTIKPKVEKFLKS